MVTKHWLNGIDSPSGFVLAKIHMVTKHHPEYLIDQIRFVLAKIHMVTKPQIHNIILNDLS